MSSDVKTGQSDGLGNPVDHVPDNMADHFAGAYKKGALAYRDGDDPSDCPYTRQYNPDSCMGGEWGHVWANAWKLGFENEEASQKDERLTPYNKAWKMGR